MINTWQQGPERIAPVFIAHNTQCALRTAMITIIESDDFGTAGYSFGQLHSAFGSFGTAVGKINTVQG